MIAFIDEHREAYGVEPICKLLPIAPSTDYAHAARRADPGKLPARAKTDAALTVEIRRVFEENFRVYGVRKSLAPRRRGSAGSSAGRGSARPAARWRAWIADPGPAGWL